MLEVAMVIFIAGLLLLAVLTADVLISRARISAAQNLSRSAPVASTKDVLFWFETSLPTSYEKEEINDGDPLATWKDNSKSSSTTLDATTESGSEPTYANTINRIHATKFSGGQHFKINGSGLNGSDYTIIIVDKRLSNADNNYFIGDPAVSTTNQTLLLGYSANGKLMHSQGTGNSYTANIESYEDSKDKPRIISFVSSSTGKQIYVNGVLAASSTNTAKLANINNLVIGKAYNGELGEVIAVARAISAAERQEIESYLSKKYTIKNSSGDCTDGTVTISGCRRDVCSVSVVGSSTGSVNNGSGNINCNQTGYSGTVAYNCSGGAPISGTCNCDSGYISSGGVCIGSCSVSVTGSSTITTTVGGSAIACNQTGYTGTVSNTCSSAGTAVTGTCGCASGYSWNGSACAAPVCRWTLVVNSGVSYGGGGPGDSPSSRSSLTCSSAINGKFAGAFGGSITVSGSSMTGSVYGFFSCVCSPSSSCTSSCGWNIAASGPVYRCDC